MKNYKLTISGLSIALGSLLIWTPIANAVSGYNLLFDANKNNGGQPLNYGNTNCYIYQANETLGDYSMTSYAFANGTFYATGDENACAAACSSWRRTISKSTNGYQFDWESRYLYVYPKGFPVDYYEPGADYTANYICKAYYTQYPGTESCFQPNLQPDPDPKKVPYLFLEHTSNYAYCDLTLVSFPLPTGSISVSPTSGAASTSYKASWNASKVLNCSWQLDGVDKGPIACNGSADLTGQSVKTHTIKLIANGFYGSSTFSANFTVNPLPTCTVSITPTKGYINGTINTAMSATWSSKNATSCTWAKDGISQGAVSCSGSTAFNASFFGLGLNHKITLTAQGPGGTNTCTSNLVNISKY